MVFKAKLERASVEESYQEMFSFLLGGALMVLLFFFSHQHLLFTVLIMKCKKNCLGERVSSSSMFSSVLLFLFALLNFICVAAVVILSLPPLIVWGQFPEG